jgi:FKBP-type peptidyl-prolyl cis-trans isomerase SlyD
MEPQSRFPDPLTVGMRFEGLPGDADSGEPLIYTVTDIAEGQVVLDGNHPLAGERVWVRARVTDIRAATAEELAQGHVHGGHGVDDAP